jgi:uncharacterized membrane protein YsdA (DUF1294 family)/cold shock CspA family protein
MQGTIVKFDSGRRFGFIRPNTGGEDIFFPASAVVSGQESIAPGATVSFETTRGDKGPNAVQIHLRAAAPVSPYKFFASATVLLTAVLYAVFVMYAELPRLYAFLSAVNGATFIVLGFDKSSAALSSNRVPEKVLFLFAALGGALGLILAMKLFRHKTQKPSFQFVVALILVAQVIALRLLVAR